MPMLSMMFSRTAAWRGWAMVFVALLTSACESKSATEPRCAIVPSAALVSALSAPASFDSLFTRAAVEFDVPAELLSAIAYVETRWQMVEGHEELGQPAAYGVMALRGARLQRGAQLAGLTTAATRTDAGANINAAAALLAELATEAPGRPATISDWAPVLEKFSGITLSVGARAYSRQVIARATPANLQTSARLSANAPPDDCKPPVVPPVVPPVHPTGPDFAGSLWRASSNFNARPVGPAGVPYVPHLLIIHTCEGAYVGCWSWLTNPVSQVSAHYVVNEEGSEISQLVSEPSRAWHIGASYNCSLNRMHDCALNNVQSNHFTIGIEHAGFAAQTSFPESQIDASARLACDITRDNDIPRDWQHIVAHGQLQPNNRTDPGPNWPWVKYVTRIQRFCGETVVDDERTYNDAAVAAPAASAWFVSDSTPGYYGSGYRWIATSEAGDDPFIFRFYQEQAASRTIETRWTSGSNRSAQVAFTVVAANGSIIGTATIDQRTGGGWTRLGSWTIPAGWNEVRLSRRGAPGTVVIADAVRIR